MEEDKKTEVTIGSLYELNKTLMQYQGEKLTQGEINSKKEIIKNFIQKQSDNYYMLLCNERKDYSLFNFIAGDKGVINCYNCVDILIDECLANRGEIRAIDITQDKGAIEI